MIIGKGEIAVMCSDEDTGLLGDVVEVPGQADHSRLSVFFTPKNISEAISEAPSDEVELFYDASDPNKPVRVEGGSGYVAVVMPRKELPGGNGG